MSAPTVTVPKYLSPKEVCELIPGMTERTLMEMRSNRRAGHTGLKAGPLSSKLPGRIIVYAAKDVETYIKTAQQVTS